MRRQARLFAITEYLRGPHGGHGRDARRSVWRHRTLRLVPFTETLGAALDKVRGALTASSQRELVELLGALRFVGVPAPPADARVRRAVEQAWFEHLPLRIEYRRKNFERSSREVMVHGVITERSMILLECDDLDGGQRRHVRLDHIERAVVLAR